jgi:hypothetical protein
MVGLSWKDKSGRAKKSIVNLEDISLSGACVQVDAALPLGTRVRLAHDKGELSGFVKYCVFREIGYFLGIEFDPGSRWSQKHFKPQHLLDPRHLIMRSINRVVRSAPRSSSTLIH